MIGPTDPLHPSPEPHFKTFQLFLIDRQYCQEKEIVLRGAQIFQTSGSHLNVLVAGRMTLGNYHAEDTQILSTTVRILVATATGLRDLCTPGNTHSNPP